MGRLGLAGRGSLSPASTPVPLPASHGAELVNASALLLLLLLNLVLIGRQDRLKRREVQRRLRGIIDQIQGEAEGQARWVGKGALRCVSPTSASPESWPGAPRDGAASGQHPGGSWHQESEKAALPSFERDSESQGHVSIGLSTARREADGSPVGLQAC